MSLTESFFVSPKLHEKTVKLPDGSEHVLHFREVPYQEHVLYTDRANSPDDDVRGAAAARLIAASLCNPDGTPALTLERALRLRTQAVSVLFAAVMEANTFGAKKTSPSEGDSGSATS